MSVERLTERLKNGAINVKYASQHETAIHRLVTIEDILGEEYDLDHLRELVEADKDGRCVVLPCKVGDKVYWIVDGGVFECFFTIAAAEEVGKTVFLTREAAEAALAKEARP